MSTYEIEYKFKCLCRKIDEIVITTSYNEITKDIWIEFIEEMEKLEENYSTDFINLFFIKYNYHSRIIWNMLQNNNVPVAIEEFKNSCLFLLKRVKIKQYSRSSMEKMSPTFSIKSKHIASYFEENCELQDFEECKYYLEILLDTLDEINIEMTDEKILADFLDEWWFSIIREIQVSILDFINELSLSRDEKELCITILDQIKGLNGRILNCFEDQLRYTYLLSLNYAILFRLTKKLFFLHLKTTFFSDRENPDISSETEKFLSDIKDYAKNENINFKRYYRPIQSELSEDDKIHFKKWELGCDIDVSFSEYLEVLYVEQDVFKAEKKLEGIYFMIIEKTMIENISVSKYQLSYFSEELAFLSFFVKIVLTNKSIQKTKRDFFNDENDWRFQLISNIESRFSDILEMFRYEPLDQDSFELKIITRALIGGFPVYIITEWIKTIVQKDAKIPIELTDDLSLSTFYECINSIEEVDKIVPNYVFPSADVSDPDIDIRLEDSALFIKNGFLNDGDIHNIRREIRYARNHEIKNTFILINFYRNMRKINQVLDLKKALETDYHQVYVMDLKYVIEGLIGVLRYFDLWKYQGMRDITKMIDY